MSASEKFPFHSRKRQEKKSNKWNEQMVDGGKCFPAKSNREELWGMWGQAVISNGGTRAGLTESGTRKAMPGGSEVRATHPCPGEVLTQRPDAEALHTASTAGQCEWVRESSRKRSKGSSGPAGNHGEHLVERCVLSAHLFKKIN